MRAAIFAIFSFAMAMSSLAGPAFDPRASLRGPDIWALIEDKVEFRENRQAASSQTSAVQQEYAGPSWRGRTRPLISEMVVDRFVQDFERVAVAMRDGISGPKMRDMVESFAGLAEASNDVARMYRHLEREKRLEGEGHVKVPGELFRGRVEAGVMTSATEWREAAELLEMNAARLSLAALMRSPPQAEQAWRAVVFSALEVPQLRSTVQAVLTRLERRVRAEERLLETPPPAAPRGRRGGQQAEAVEAAPEPEPVE